MNSLIIIATFLISLAIGIVVGMTIRKKIAESKIESAEQEAKRVVDLAKVEAENMKKEEIFKAKEEIMNSRKELDQEIKERRSEVFAVMVIRRINNFLSTIRSYNSITASIIIAVDEVCLFKLVVPCACFGTFLP